MCRSLARPGRARVKASCSWGIEGSGGSSSTKASVMWRVRREVRAEVRRVARVASAAEEERSRVRVWRLGAAARREGVWVVGEKDPAVRLSVCRLESGAFSRLIWIRPRVRLSSAAGER